MSNTRMRAGNTLSIPINEYSASASEILAACVQDYGKEFLVGTKHLEKDLYRKLT